MNRDPEGRLLELVEQTPWLMSALAAVRDVGAPEAYIGGGVLRALAWDRLHGHARPTPLRDVDVAFFDPERLSPERDLEVEQALFERIPEIPWQAKNQAAVHLWYERVFGYRVEPLVSIFDAVATWPETATCVAVRMLPGGGLDILAPFGAADLMGQILRRNPRRASVGIFEKRLLEKRILEHWPGVRVIRDPAEDPKVRNAR